MINQTIIEEARSLALEFINGDRVQVIKRIEHMDPYRSRAVVALMVGRFLRQSAQAFLDIIVDGAKHTESTVKA